MSLSVDGTWKAGVWATTVWKLGVWREGAPAAAAPSEFATYGVAFPPEIPAAADRGRLDPQADAEFNEFARLVELEQYLERVALAFDEEAVNPLDDPFGLDEELFGSDFERSKAGTKRRR